MARMINALGPGKHTDGGGLFLLVKPTGSRSWVLRIQYDNRRRDIGVGPYPSIGLAKARERAATLRAEVLDGIDPIAKRASARAQRMTFEQAAKATIEAKRPEWSNEKHAAQWSSTLETYAYPVLGPLDVRDIEPEHVLEVLRPIWAEKSETASRVRMRIEAVLDYATATKSRSGPNPAVWKGNLDAVLARPSKVRAVVNHAALPWREMQLFMSQLVARPGMGAMALRFTILTATRSGEVRGATWDEIDVGAATWTVQAHRMKARREHRVPLAKQALEILHAVREVSDADDLVFPSGRSGRPLSDMTLTAVVKRMGRDDLTVHGFRSSFRDWAAEATNYPGELAEAALAHTVRNATEAAYRRGDLFEKRRRMMRDWARHCFGKTGQT
ncbi:MAG: integrase arm-type DNA-binding domain-containing protein [Pseudomonadota bacterium]